MYTLADLVKRGVFTLVGEIPHYRNVRHDYYFVYNDYYYAGLQMDRSELLKNCQQGAASLTGS